MPSRDLYAAIQTLLAEVDRPVVFRKIKAHVDGARVPPDDGVVLLSPEDILALDPAGVQANQACDVLAGETARRLAVCQVDAAILAEEDAECLAVLR